MSEIALSRQEQKERTRDALLAATLELSLEHGFAQVSLRQVTREAGIVPTAFYRHFDSMESVGLELVAQSFALLRRRIRESQRDPDLGSNIVAASVDIVTAAVRDNRSHFAFVARERVGGSTVVSEAILRELELFISETAVVLAQIPVYRGWNPEDVQMVSGLFVRNLVYRGERLVALGDVRPEQLEQLKEKMRREMRLILVGVKNWRS